MAGNATPGVAINVLLGAFGAGARDNVALDVGFDVAGLEAECRIGVESECGADISLGTAGRPSARAGLMIRYREPKPWDSEGTVSVGPASIDNEWITIGVSSSRSILPISVSYPVPLTSATPGAGGLESPRDATAVAPVPRTSQATPASATWNARH